MATYGRALLSGSTNGRLIQIAATATLGTTIHTAVSGTSNLDVITLFATNTSASVVALTLEIGGTGAANNMVVSIPGQSGDFPILSNQMLQNGLVLTAFAGTTNVINIGGYVNTIR
jgi:hypothetical protein